MELFTIDSGSNFNVFGNSPYGTKLYATEFSRYLCKSGIADADGKCTEGETSLNKSKRSLKRLTTRN